jgi:asparagine synthase (glutamine-hydrolysing)
MCGIAGFQGQYPRHALTRLSAAIRHRGPDHSGEWVHERSGTGLAHRRLSIIDVSARGNQPMVDRRSQATMVFNGEIYNYRALRAELAADGHRFCSDSDSEVLLALFCAHGESMLTRLNGIFAFAIHDPADDSLFIACDAMGVKPVYYSDGVSGFVFASELKALLDAGVVDRTLDVEALYRTLGFIWSPGGATPVRSVRRLGPGQALRVRGGQLQRSWTWAPPAWSATTQPIPDGAAVAAVTAAVRTAVHRQMVADVPVGAFLSGGLDSSAVVAMAREQSPHIDCFTIDTGPAMDAGVTDDLPYARRVARHLGVRLHEIHVDATRMAADLSRMVEVLDEPLADPASLHVMYISQLARQHGIKVLLSGAGGDDIFTGYRRHRALMAEERYWGRFPRPVRRALRTGSATLGTRTVAGRRIAKAFAHADWPAGKRLAGYFLWADPERVRSLFAPEHRHQLGQLSMTGPLETYLGTISAEHPLQRMLALEQRFYLPDHNLLYTDRMSMAAGVEVRVPLLDTDLVRLANLLPPDLKQRGRHGKWVLKRAMEPYLPADVIHRPKTGFGAPVRRWLRHDLRELVDDTLDPAVLRRRGLFDPGAVAALVADDRAGRVDAAYTIMGLLCIELWCRRYAA